MDIIKLPESFAHEVRSMTAYVTDVDHHVARQFPLDLEPPALHHRVMGGRSKELEQPDPD